MLAINETEVKEILSVKACIPIMKDALAALANDEAIQNLRSVTPIDYGNLLGQMPGYLKKDNIIGTKVISVFSRNHEQALPSHQGVVLLFDATNGKLKASIDATSITAIRTAAVSAVATDLLAQPNGETLCILGAGEQARTHLEAMFIVRQIKQVKVWSRNEQTAFAFKQEMEAQLPVNIQVYESAKAAALDADIICTVTASDTPVLKGEWVKDGAHVNAVGACRPHQRELDSELIAQSELYVDRMESATAESGDYLIPLQEGKIKPNHIIGEIGEIITGKINGRSTAESITVFDSLGLAIEDLAAANFIYEQAKIMNKGTQI